MIVFVLPVRKLETVLMETLGDFEWWTPNTMVEQDFKGLVTNLKYFSF